MLRWECDSIWREVSITILIQLKNNPFVRGVGADWGVTNEKRFFGE